MIYQIIIILIIFQIIIYDEKEEKILNKRLNDSDKNIYYQAIENILNDDKKRKMIKLKKRS